MPVEDGVQWRIVVNLLLAGLGGASGVGDRRQHAVVDRHLLSRVLRLSIGVRDNDRDRIADIKGLAVRERRERSDLHRRSVLGVDGPAGNVSADLVGDRVGAGKYCNDAGRFHRRRRIDPVDRRMRVRRAHEIGVGLARTVDVVDVVALAGNEPVVFLALDGGANAGRAHVSLPQNGLKRAVTRRPWTARRRPFRARPGRPPSRCCDSRCSGRCCLQARGGSRLRRDAGPRD